MPKKENLAEEERTVEKEVEVVSLTEVKQSQKKAELQDVTCILIT